MLQQQIFHHSQTPLHFIFSLTIAFLQVFKMYPSNAKQWNVTTNTTSSHFFQNYKVSLPLIIYDLKDNQHWWLATNLDCKKHFAKYILSHFAKYILYFHHRQISVDCWQSHLIPLQKAFLLKLYLLCKWKIVVDAVDTKNINIVTHPKTFI